MDFFTVGFFLVPPVVIFAAVWTISFFLLKRYKSKGVSAYWATLVVLFSPLIIPFVLESIAFGVAMVGFLINLLGMTLGACRDSGCGFMMLVEYSFWTLLLWSGVITKLSPYMYLTGAVVGALDLLIRHLKTRRKF